MEKDFFFIKKTFSLAMKGEGNTSPNPLVGAVIVKGDKIISSGYHKKCGEAHAEAEAINKAKVSLRGTSLYLNLEPCCHFGRTPPCVDAIIRAKIKRAVISVIDPNPLINGKSVAKLREAGIEVELGVGKEAAVRLNEVFFKNMKEKRPFVAVKAAQSLDGKIAARRGASKWITSAGSREFAKSLRDKYDCVLVGINTVIKDNPRLKGLKKNPYKAVIDPQLNIPLNSNLVKENPDKLIIFASDKTKHKKKIPSSVKVFFIKEEKGRIILRKALEVLYRLGIMSVFVEGGADTLGGFFDQKIADKVYFFIAPKIIGGKEALSSVGGKGFISPDRCCDIKEYDIKRFSGGDILISGYPSYEICRGRLRPAR